MGTKAWLEERDLSTSDDDDGKGWNGYRGNNKWIAQTVKSDDDDKSKPPRAKRAAYGQDTSDTTILTDNIFLCSHNYNKANDGVTNAYNINAGNGAESSCREFIGSHGNYNEKQNDEIKRLTRLLSEQR